LPARLGGGDGSVARDAAARADVGQPPAPSGCGHGVPCHVCAARDGAPVTPGRGCPAPSRAWRARAPPPGGGGGAPPPPGGGGGRSTGSPRGAGRSPRLRRSVGVSQWKVATPPVSTWRTSRRCLPGQNGWRAARLQVAWRLAGEPAVAGHRRGPPTGGEVGYGWRGGGGGAAPRGGGGGGTRDRAKKLGSKKLKTRINFFRCHTRVSSGP